MNATHHNRGGASPRLLVVILLGACVAGAYNYYRNWQLETAEPRGPLAGYATADLEALADAYRAEVKAGTARYESARKGRAKSQDRAYFDEQVHEFEKVQRASGARREVGAQLAEKEVSLRAVEDELAKRGPELGEWQRHWQRLTRL